LGDSGRIVVPDARGQRDTGPGVPLVLANSHH
jgi:hypothetical protein